MSVKPLSAHKIADTLACGTGLAIQTVRDARPWVVRELFSANSRCQIVTVRRTVSANSLRQMVIAEHLGQIRASN
ncbi:hypothetical protein K239x_25980 [Planctomycetes bacterium K23_9]|uniref:Uncharacterized protein n=1 Tax=Stieleria marina TaxID=1930275 RepID=A0A517NU46_9BACT|nr:hypothetical protein K239x_25980 [Planctomycetes bacterium K23_9]